MEMMKAAINTRYGPPEVVSVKSIKKPEPNPNQILVRVMFATVNRTDCGFRSAEYFISRFFSGLFKPKFHTLGCEFSGIIKQVGENIKEYKPGDRVFGFNDSHFGAHAEYLILNKKDVFCKFPENISYENAACLSEGGHYALTDIKAAGIKSGHKVLINGATGAIGSAAVQICIYLGAEVTAVCSTENIEIVSRFKPKHIVDYKKQDFTQLDEQFDLVFDAVGKSRFSKCKNILKPEGIYISTELGPYWENPFMALWTSFFGKKKLLFPIPLIKKEDLEFLLRLYLEGAYLPLIDRQFSLDSIVDAYKYVETGMKTGNVLVKTS